AVRQQDNGELHVWTPPRLIEPEAHPGPTPQRLAEEATRQRLEPILEQLRGTEIGEWADSVLRDVEIVHTADPSEHGFKPSLRRLVIDVGLTDEQHLGELVHQAIHAELAAHRDPVEVLRQQHMLSREAYINQMIGEETRAHAMEILGALELQAAGIDVPDPVGTRAYVDTYEQARARLAESMGVAGRPEPPDVAATLDRLAS
ncbi:hypothetical protein ACW9HQ_46965, partial [Nocardia gipuzkoensis]